jgi:hypothetical protein
MLKQTGMREGIMSQAKTRNEMRGDYRTHPVLRGVRAHGAFGVATLAVNTCLEWWVKVVFEVALGHIGIEGEAVDAMGAFGAIPVGGTLWPTVHNEMARHRSGPRVP